MSLISIQKTDSYAPAGMKAAVAAHFAALEVEKDLFPGMKVLLKPNLLAARRPEQGVTTHPALVQAVIDWLRERGVEDITLADSPGLSPMVKRRYSARFSSALQIHSR